jgi:hypothetical protein
VVEIWDGTRSDALAGKVGELRARIESLEAVMEVQPQGPAPACGRRRQSAVKGGHPQRLGVADLEARAVRLEESEMARRARSTVNRSPARCSTARWRSR